MAKSVQQANQQIRTAPAPKKPSTSLATAGKQSGFKSVPVVQSVLPRTERRDRTVAQLDPNSGLGKLVAAGKSSPWDRIRDRVREAEVVKEEGYKLKARAKK